MIVRKLRLQRGWSQEQLAELSGLNVRTIQRIERGQNAGLESLKSLAAVFETDISELQEEIAMIAETTLSTEEQQAMEYVRDIKAFYAHLIGYLFSTVLMFTMNFIFMPYYIWAWWPTFGWGMGILIHGLVVFEVLSPFGTDWEKRQIEKRLRRKL